MSKLASIQEVGGSDKDMQAKQNGKHRETGRNSC